MVVVLENGRGKVSCCIHVAGEAIDSMRAWADSLESDPATLERLARERYGMIKDGEVLYRFIEPDSSSDTTRS